MPSFRQVLLNSTDHFRFIHFFLYFSYSLYEDLIATGKGCRYCPSDMAKENKYILLLFIPGKHVSVYHRSSSVPKSTEKLPINQLLN